MSNGSAVRSGMGAIWVGALSASISALTLVLVAVAIYRLPPSRYKSCHGPRDEEIVVGGLMGAFLVAALALRRPQARSDPDILYFLVIAVVSALIDSFGLLGTEAKPLRTQQLIGVALAGVGRARALLTEMPCPAGPAPHKPSP